MELRRCAGLCQVVLEGHLCMAAVITLDRDRGSGSESDFPKFEERFASCLTRARAMREHLVRDGTVVIPSGMAMQLARAAKVVEVGPQSWIPFISLSV